MSDANRELILEDFPLVPLSKLVDRGGDDVFQRTEVGGEAAVVGALFSSRELAEEFSEEARNLGMDSLAGLETSELDDWKSVEEFALSGQDHILVVTERGTGLFFASDVAARVSDSGEGSEFPLYIFADESGESPLISVENNDETLLVAALFTSPEKAEAFRERASHLDLPETLGTVQDGEGLSRHARVAKRAGADYAVTDPESGLTDAIPLEELM